MCLSVTAKATFHQDVFNTGIKLGSVALNLVYTAKTCKV
jgi:hypothetical protein